MTAFVEQEFGAWYVPGGLRRIVDALDRRCRDLGVEILTDTRVLELPTAGGRVSGVRCADREIPADAVVSDADATALYGRLIKGAPARITRALRRTPRSMAGFVMLLGLSGRTPGAAPRIFFPDDYDAAFDATFGPAPPHVVAKRPDGRLHVAE